MEGITSDINTYNKGVRGEFLARKYCVDIDEQVYKGSVIIFRLPSPSIFDMTGLGQQV